MIYRVLLVDDEPMICETTKEILEEAGYQVKVAGSLAEGMQALEGESWHILIADLNLPDGSGLTLATNGRTLQPRLRIALMTGQAQDAEPAGLQARQEAIVDEYLVKPVSPPQLLRVIRRLLG